ncbi:hypothetical protein BX666DRAFT_1874320 [Dichotomocladium elegans]|nr:hypothetical protein BX666DRAFT_1874320 [Dichotomocladium elegans]
MVKTVGMDALLLALADTHIDIDAGDEMDTQDMPTLILTPTQMMVLKLVMKALCESPLTCRPTIDWIDYCFMTSRYGTLRLKRHRYAQDEIVLRVYETDALKIETNMKNTRGKRYMGEAGQPMETLNNGVPGIKHQSICDQDMDRNIRTEKRKATDECRIEFLEETEVPEGYPSKEAKKRRQSMVRASDRESSEWFLTVLFIME